jgi:hypothetical protein
MSTLLAVYLNERLSARLHAFAVGPSDRNVFDRLALRREGRFSSVLSLN